MKELAFLIILSGRVFPDPLFPTAIIARRTGMDHVLLMSIIVSPIIAAKAIRYMAQMYSGSLCVSFSKDMTNSARAGEKEVVSKNAHKLE